MAYDQIHIVDATSQMIEIALRSSTTGQLLTGKAYGDMTVKYQREGAASATTVSVVTATKGSYTSGGFVETDIAGLYQFGIPNGALATGAKAVTLTFVCSGVLDVVKRIVLIGADLRNATSLGLANLDVAVSSRSTYAGGDTSGVTTLLSRIIGTLATGTHNPQSGDAYARLIGTVEPAIADLPTNAELATALGTADDATLAAIAALNNLSSAQAQSAATAALNAYDPPTNAEFEARTLVAANYFDSAVDTVARVTLVDTTTTNTDMVAAAPSAAANADAVWDELLAGHVGVGSAGAALTAASSGGDPSVLADAVWDELLSGHVGIGSAGAGLAAAGSAGDPWSTTLPGAYTGNQAGAILDGIRDVTDAIDVSAVTVTASNDAGVLTVVQAVTFGATVSGLTISATWAKLYWTLKESIYDDDDQAILQLVESNPGAGTDGLLYLDSAAIALPITVADGTLTVNQAGGTVVIAVTDNATALLSAASELVWDIKTKDAAGNTVQNTTGTASIVRAVTQTI